MYLYATIAVRHISALRDSIQTCIRTELKLVFQITAFLYGNTVKMLQCFDENIKYYDEYFQL